MFENRRACNGDRWELLLVFGAVGCCLWLHCGWTGGGGSSSGVGDGSSSGCIGCRWWWQMLAVSCFVRVRCILDSGSWWFGGFFFGGRGCILVQMDLFDLRKNTLVIYICISTVYEHTIGTLSCSIEMGIARDRDRESKSKQT